MALSSGALRDRLAELTLRDEHRLGRRLQRARREPRALERIAGEIERAAALVERRRAAVPTAIRFPEELPVSQHRDELAAAIRDHQVVVVAGETGSGKTTQLPKICLELGRGVRGTIAHTQPRRIAARTVAQRIADELEVPLGSTVGYAVRFSDRSREDTLVRLLTDGLLLAEIQHDRLLRRYDTIIVDEAHERSLNIDFLLGYLARLLPQRPDLKVIITSATIDPERFAEHFGDAPIVEVSGRTYPVEVRYRPPDEDAELVDAIGDAVAELCAEAPRGDVLVFLSGEREIRDAAEALGGRFGSSLEVLPLYARLSSAEQQRVFAAHDGRRVVLATNVAETSLTVPGIRYVVDPGTARISRYSARLKVQRLPIEPVSQASADQRKGRCGRVAEGICIRLYSEEDFLERPRFTDPEILRTSLAAVILQMAALGLGDVEDFPFLDPPDRRQVRDGINLLTELGALDEARLTPLGRRLAQLPVDPRLGRMVLEADRLSCAQEVMIIAAGLSIQDPRERPTDFQAQADQAHARFKDEESDFVAYLNLWRYLREQQRALSGNQFRKRCRSEYLNYLRVREWQDLVEQLRQSSRAAAITINQKPCERTHLHQALLSGLLSHIGLRDAARREYAGARGARFSIFPGSALARKQPTWVMVAELVETSRLFGREAARIDPAWIEPLAGHLVKRTYSEPRWDPKRAQVVATERVTLYGLPIVTGRRVGYAGIDPALSRQLFVQRALVEGEWETRHAFVEENQRRVAEVERREERERRRDILVDDATLYAFFAERVPESVVSGRHFDRWWRDARRTDPELLVYPRELLVRPEARDESGPPTRPDTWKQGEVQLRLSYKFEPGSDRDGVSVHVPLTVLPQLRPGGFDWLVPALREELVTTLLRGLPKELRRALVPVPDTAAAVVPHLRPRRGRLIDAVAREVEALRAVSIPADAFAGALERLPPHLRMTFVVEDERGAVLAEGFDLEALREQLRPRLRAELTAATAGLERHGLHAWPEDVDPLPREVALPGTGGAVRAFPALADEDAAVGIATLDDADAQGAAMWAGTRRLLLLTIPRPKAPRLANAAQLALAGAPHGSLAAVLDDAATAACDRLMARAGGPAWDRAGFARLRDVVAADLADEIAAIVAEVVGILDEARALRGRFAAMTAAPLREARDDVAGQLGRLVFPGFITDTGADRLPDVRRYLQAAARRLDRLADNLAPDRDRLRAIRELEAEYDARVAAAPRDRPLPPALVEARWALQELRVSQFAQGIGVRGSVSAKRIRRLITS